MCNLVGLAFSLAGVLLLFYYALPNELPGAPSGLNVHPGDQQLYQVAWGLYDRYSHIGLYLVLIGTLLEAVPPLCTAIGSWRRRRIAPQVLKREEMDDGW